MAPIRVSYLVSFSLLLMFVSLADGLQAGALKELPDGAASADQVRLLDELATAPDYLTPAMRLRDTANSGVLAKLDELASHKSSDVRQRAGFALSLIPTRPTLSRCLALALADPDAQVREGVASSLLSGDTPKLLGEADLMAECKKGLADRKSGVQLPFALILQRNGDPAGLEVLKKGLKNKDHHWQETAAEALAELGDDSGAAILIKMLKYTDKNHPMLRANSELRKDESAWNNLLNTVNEERVRVCAHLARIRCQKALPVLEKCSQSDDPRVAEAASSAIAAINAPAEESEN